LQHGVSAGIHLRLLGEGFVPILEEHTARVERNIGLNKWAKMDVTEKALIIALRRLNMAMKNLQSEAEIVSAEKKSGKR
jgi:hypothetical protein